MELLKDESHLFGAVPVQFLRSQTDDALAVDPNNSLRGTVQAAQDVQQRRLAGT